ncbi:YitT family protein [Luteimonas yindakuii]|nr:YitT family protein [Luteimonas yindakuii]QCO66760.1 YitT family protein [Luteimonas yindakuii]
MPMNAAVSPLSDPTPLPDGAGDAGSPPPVTSGPLTPPPDSAGTPAAAATARHTVAEDVQGLLLATLTASLGLAVFADGGLVIGGMAGIALMLHHALGWAFGLTFVLVNLPFYWLAARRMGWEFTLKTFCAVAAVGWVADALPRWVSPAEMSPLYAAIVGGALTGLGILFFIRHRASLGGVGILAVYLQRSRGWSAGRIQMGFDAALMTLALLLFEPGQVLYSAIGAAVLSLVIMFNHRPGRYMGV